MVMRKKKAALEMSMSTIITIVLSVAFLILGLSVLRNFYGFQSQSINSIEDKTLQEINKLYLNDEENNVRLMIELGSEKTANIRSGTDNFGFGIYGTTLSNERLQNDTSMKFALWLDVTSQGNCADILSASKVRSWFTNTISDSSTTLVWLNSDRFYDSTGGVLIQLGIPAGTKVCSQKVYVKGMDGTADPSDNILGQDFFVINVLRQSPF